MKMLTQMMIVIVLSLISMFAHANEYYTIERFDTLSQIAEDHHTTVKALVKANGIKNPNRIFVGQVIVIEEPAVHTAGSSAGDAQPAATNSAVEKEFRWKKPGAEKCTSCNLDEFLGTHYPADVAQVLAEKFTNGSYANKVDIQNGDRFDAMMFGRNKTRSNVVVNWKQSHTELAAVYVVEQGDTQYRLVVPEICGNFAKQVTKVPPTAPPIVQAVPEPVPPPPEIPPKEIVVCKTCPKLKASYIFPALPEGSPIENAQVRKFYGNQ